MPNQSRVTPTTRASSAREATREANKDRTSVQGDPNKLPPEQRQPALEGNLAADDYARHNPPNPQTGPSSSELNSTPGFVKDEMIKDQEGPDQTPEKK